MILNYWEEGWFHIFAFGKSNAAIYYSPIESPKVTALRKWPLKIFSPPNEQSLFRSTYAEFRNSKSLRITKNSPLFLITTLKFSNELVSLLVTAIVVWPSKMVLVTVRYLFYQLMDDKIKTFTLRFPAIENPNNRGQSCCSMTSKRSIDWFYESFRAWSFFHPSVLLTNQNPRAFVFVR